MCLQGQCGELVSVVILGSGYDLQMCVFLYVVFFRNRKELQLN